MSTRGGTEERMDLPTQRSRDRSLAFAIAWTCLLGFALFHRGRLTSTDEVTVFEATRSLFERGALDVPASIHTFTGRDGRIYGHFAIGQSLLALPFYALGRLATTTLPSVVCETLAGPHVGRASGSVELFMVSFYPATASAALVALFFLFQRRLGASSRASAAASLLLAATTYVGAMSTYFLQHTTEALAIVGSLYFLYRFRLDGRVRDLAMGSFCAAATLLIRLPAAVSGPALAAYALFVLRERARAGASVRRMLVALALPSAACFAVHMAVNHAKWGTWVASPFVAQAGALGSPFTSGLVGLLVSPGAGLFAYSPLTLLGPKLGVFFMRRHRAESITALAIVLSFLLLGGSFPIWTGLWSAPGPRYLFVATPLILLPLGLWLDESRGFRLVVLLATAGCVVQLALLGADWTAVIATNHYLTWRPPMGFVWTLGSGPIPASVRAVAQGRVGAWLWTVATGWKGRPGTPQLALGLLSLWAIAFSAAALRLGRALLAAERPASPEGAERAI